MDATSDILIGNPPLDGEPFNPEPQQHRQRALVDDDPSPSTSKALRAVVWLILSLAILASAAQLTWLVFDLEHKSYGEGPILAMIERMRSELISRSWMSEPPYTLSCYGPAYYWLTSAVAQAGGWQLSFVPGRLIVLASTLAIAILLAVTASRATKRIEMGFMGALIFLVSLPVTDWVPHARVDMLALAFSAAAYLSVSRKPTSILLPAVLIVVGSLAKPTAAFSALPIAAHWLAAGRFRQTAIFSALLTVLGALAWLVVERVSGGFFLTAVLSGNRNPMQLWRGYFFTYLFLECPVAVAALLVTCGTLVVAPQRVARSLFSLGFLVSLTTSAVAVCKRGAELNYFLEPTLLGSLALAIDGLPSLWQASQRRSLFGMAAVAMLISLPNFREMKSHLRASLKEPAAYETVRSTLAAETSDVGILADGRQVDMVLKAGHQPWVNDSYLYTLLVENGTLDPLPLIARLRDGRIKWLVFRRAIGDHQEAGDRESHCWPLDTMEIMTRQFELVTAENGVWIYRHRQVCEEP